MSFLSQSIIHINVALGIRPKIAGYWVTDPLFYAMNETGKKYYTKYGRSRESYKISFLDTNNFSINRVERKM